LIPDGAFQEHQSVLDWTPWWAWPLGIIISLLCLWMGVAIAFG